MKKLLKTNKPNTFIEVELYYCKGGQSEYERERNPRSYRLSVEPVEVEHVAGITLYSKTYTVTTGTPSNGITLILNRPARASKKAEAEAEAIAEKIYLGYARQIAIKNELTLVD